MRRSCWVEGAGDGVVLFRRKDGERNGAGEDDGEGDDGRVDGDVRFAAGDLGEANCAGGKEDRVDGRQVIVLGVHDDHHREEDEVGDGNEAPPAGTRGEAKPENAANPDGSGGEEQDLDLLVDKDEGRATEVFV
jgi:hypothetical protein